VNPGALCAGAGVVAGLGPGGSTRLEEVRSSPPLALRFAAGSLWMVGTAAGPLAGDRLALRIEVRRGASLTLRSVAASVALGGCGDDHSELRVEAEVEAGGELCWLPEPTIATAGCHHRAVTRIRLAPDARLVWRDEVLLGRHGEDPGRWASRIEVEVGGMPLVRQELRVGPDAPGWAGPAVSGGAGALGMVIVVDPVGEREPPEPAKGSLGSDVAVLALADSGSLVSAVAPDAPELRRRLDAGVAFCASRRLPG
jgi:urease accessory protein